VFTTDIGTWWKRGTRYWNDADAGLELRFEPHVGGRLIEVADLASGEGFEIGRVLAWEPGKRLVFTWRQADWEPTESTDVEVRFEPAGTATRVTIEHGGWDRVPSAVAMTEGYSAGWVELLGFYADAAEARRTFIHLALHHPRPEHADELLASMRRVDEAAQGAPGLIQIGAWRDEKRGVLVGLALWESAEAFQASAGRIFQVVEDAPFDEWLERPPDVFHLTRPE
jgi:uncharacterized protein YndB with AHSA1/START domain/quinol monooxygenase YgiN